MVVRQRKIFCVIFPPVFYRVARKKDWALLSSWKCAVVSARVMPVVP